MTIILPARITDGPIGLRPLRAEDAAPYAGAFVADPDLGTLLGVEQDPDEASVLKQVTDQERRAADGKSVQLAIVDHDVFCGAVSAFAFDWHHRRCEVGYWVRPEHRQRGLASTAVRAVISWLFSDLDLLRIEMTTTPDNPVVPALAAKLGFTQEGVLRARNIERGRRVDIIWFGLLRDEWAA